MSDLSALVPWAALGSDLLKVLAAFAFTLPIAWERERTTRRIGLRTLSLVAVASCGYVLVAIEVLGSSSDAQARVLQGLMTGVGFVGGGAILREGGTVRGTSTAVSIWTTGIIGAAIAYEYYRIAVIISLINYLAFQVLTPVVHQVESTEGAEGSERDKKQ